MKFVLSFFCLFLVFSSNAQYKGRKHRVSSDAGAIFLSYGLNRAGYTRSKAHFEGIGYNFDLTSVYGKDSPNQYYGNQFNLKLGYYYLDNISITFSFDHMEYQIRDKGFTKLTGQTTFTSDNYIYFNQDQSYYHGVWNLVPIFPDPDYFDYSYTGGINLMHVDITRTNELFRKGRARQFIVNSYYGAGFGLIQSSLNFVYNQERFLNVNSLSGYSLLATAGMRVEFFRKMYFYINSNIGILHQVRAKAKRTDSNALVRQLMAYAQIDAGIGLLFFKRSKNGCQDCPRW